MENLLQTCILIARRRTIIHGLIWLSYHNGSFFDCEKIHSQNLNYTNIDYYEILTTARYLDCVFININLLKLHLLVNIKNCLKKCTITIKKMNYVVRLARCIQRILKIPSRLDDEIPLHSETINGLIFIFVDRIIPQQIHSSDVEWFGKISKKMLSVKNM